MCVCCNVLVFSFLKFSDVVLFSPHLVLFAFASPILSSLPSLSDLRIPLFFSTPFTFVSLRFVYSTMATQQFPAVSHPVPSSILSYPSTLHLHSPCSLLPLSLISSLSPFLSSPSLLLLLPLRLPLQKESPWLSDKVTLRFKRYMIYVHALSLMWVNFAYSFLPSRQVVVCMGVNRGSYIFISFHLYDPRLLVAATASKNCFLKGGSCPPFSFIYQPLIF